jgi:hypothetical protein
MTPFPLLCLFITGEMLMIKLYGSKRMQSAYLLLQTEVFDRSGNSNYLSQKKTGSSLNS